MCKLTFIKYLYHQDLYGLIPNYSGDQLPEMYLKHVDKLLFSAETKSEADI